MSEVRPSTTRPVPWSRTIRGDSGLALLSKVRFHFALKAQNYTEPAEIKVYDTLKGLPFDEPIHGFRAGEHCWSVPTGDFMPTMRNGQPQAFRLFWGRPSRKLESGSRKSKKDRDGTLWLNVNRNGKDRLEMLRKNDRGRVSARYDDLTQAAKTFFEQYLHRPSGFYMDCLFPTACIVTTNITSTMIPTKTSDSAPQSALQKEQTALRGAVRSESQKAKPLVLSYEDNSLIFHYSAPFYDEEEANEFSCFLEGYDEKFSAWSRKTMKEYTNLYEGEYTFRLKSKMYTEEREQKRFSASGCSPLGTETWWACSIYFLGLVLLIRFIVYLNTRKVKRQNLKLENTVAERTENCKSKPRNCKSKPRNCKPNPRNCKPKPKNSEITLDTVSKQKNTLRIFTPNIQSSITSAARIQAAVLPFKEKISAEFPENFVLFKPRDVVSGDFYWFEKIKDKLLLCVADCTGHGVPGAFMSMLGCSGSDRNYGPERGASAGKIITQLDVQNSAKPQTKRNRQPGRYGHDLACA